jgi:hypothetical protein
MSDRFRDGSSFDDFARRVYARMREIERQTHVGRSALTSDPPASRLPQEQELYEAVNRSRADRAFSRDPVLGETPYSWPRPFFLNIFEPPITQALCFFTNWKDDHPTLYPSEETRHRCLSTAFQTVSMYPTYPGAEFVEYVASLFDQWAATKACDFHLARSAAAMAAWKNL